MFRGKQWLAVSMMFLGATPAIADDAAQRLEVLQRRSDEVQRQIDLILAKIETLREGVVLERFADTRVRVAQKDGLDGAMHLIGAKYVFDGVEILKRSFEPKTAPAELEVILGTMTPGSHRMEVSLEFSGGGFGVFTYAEDYKYKVTSAFKFEVPEGRATEVAVVPFLRDDMTKELKDRLAIRFDRQVREISPAGEGNVLESNSETPASK